MEPAAAHSRKYHDPDIFASAAVSFSAMLYGCMQYGCWSATFFYLTWGQNGSADFDEIWQAEAGPPWTVAVHLRKLAPEPRPFVA